MTVRGTVSLDATGMVGKRARMPKEFNQNTYLVAAHRTVVSLTNYVLFQLCKCHPPNYLSLEGVIKIKKPTQKPKLIYDPFLIIINLSPKK